MISHNFRKLCNYTSVCYDNTTLSNCCFCIFLTKNYKLSKRTILKKDVWEKKKFWVPTRNQNSDFKILHSDALPLSLRDSMVSEVHYKVHIWHAFFFVPHSWPDKRHLSLFLNQVQNLPSLLFYLRTILFLINRTLWHGHGLAQVGK